MALAGIFCAAMGGAAAQEKAPAPPTYKPAFTWSAANGTPGRTLDGLNALGDTRYSDDIRGPFGAPVSAKQSLRAGSMWFGAYLLDHLNLREGDDLWVRIYQFFPESFCFSYGGGENDGWGATKWIRAQTSSGRSTIELGTAGTMNDPTYAFKRNPTCGTVTAMYGDINEMGAGNRPFPQYTSAPIVRGRWQAIQVHWRFGPNGFVRGWVDDKYLGQSNHTTLRSGARVEEIVYGDYWNGGIPKNQHFYFDEIIITTQQPNTVDDGGRPFIHPGTRVSSFSSGAKQPLPPTSLLVQ